MVDIDRWSLQNCVANHHHFEGDYKKTLQIITHITKPSNIDHLVTILIGNVC